MRRLYARPDRRHLSRDAVRKTLVHGPCGGQRNGRCEVNPENECAWLRIYRKLKELDRLDLLEADRADKDYRSTAYPQAHSLREIRKKGGTP